VSQRIDAVLLDVVLNSFHLLSHAEAIKNFVFLGREDFGMEVMRGISYVQPEKMHF
jgi:hypothetical protein